VASYTSTNLAWRERNFEILADGRILVRDSQPGDASGPAR
jgi:hypothetical protein